MEKILIIPHHPALPNIKIRLVEIARSLSRQYSVYLVSWRAAQERHSLRLRLFLALKDIFVKSKVYKKGALNIVEFPILHRPLCFVPKFNSFWLERIIEKEKIDVVINGSYYMFSIPGKRDFKYIFDIPDLPVEQTKTYFDRFISQQTKRELEKADAITVSSGGLLNYVSQNYYKQALFIPNGADIEKLRSVGQAELDKIRQRYNLAGKWVIGYIGHIGSWVNIDLLIGVFKEIKKNTENAVLFIVGSCPGPLKRRFSMEGVIFTNGINSDEIDAYFSAIDLGIIPSRKSLFQDLAFHLKAIEYTAARKFIVATPSEEMQRLNFPNFIFAKEEKGAWVRAIEKARQMRWDERWDSLIDDYDWSKISQKFIGIIRS
jgi:glycosyltransferase involved in cell wall biosynthesis